MLKIGSLCTGYGGLDMAVEAYYGAETVWVSEFDKYASKVIEARINKPNLGNLKVINWAELEPIDILTAGYPCQPFSHAGLRKGVEDERHLWPYIKTAISTLRPSYVILENVRGHFGLGFREVLCDFTSIGYDVRWTLIRASDVGAPHRRERLFILAYPNSTRWPRAKPSDLQAQQSWNSSSNTYEYTNTDGQRCYLGQNYGNEVEYQGQSQLIASRLVEAITTHTDGDTRTQSRRASRELRAESTGLQRGQDKGQARGQSRGSVKTVSDTDDGRGVRTVPRLSQRYDPRSSMHLQEVPTPLDQGKLNVKFVEYMMGLPNGWVTDIDLPRAQMLKILGNGVVPQQAYRVLELLNNVK